MESRIEVILRHLKRLEREQRYWVEELRRALAEEPPVSDARLESDDALTPPQVEALAGERGWPVVGATTLARLVAACPVSRSELERAAKITDAEAARPGMDYFLSVLEGLRNKQVQRLGDRTTGQHPGSSSFGNGDQVI